MTTFEQKSMAFKSWNSGACPDEDLKICLDAMEDLNDTMMALGIHDITRTGFITLQHSLELARNARKARVEQMPKSEVTALAGIDASDTRRIYDIFWMEDDSLVKVAWKDDSNRDTPIQKNDDGLFVNAAPLPEGQPAGSAKLVGSVKLPRL